jgi:hypothetical protein
MSQRSRSDLIKQSVFDHLDKLLDESGAQNLRKLANKFIAHAADMKSRASLSNSGVELKSIERIHRAIIRVERVITDFILFIAVARDVVPMQPLGFLAGLDFP